MNKILPTPESGPSPEGGIHEAYRLVLGEVDQLRRARNAIDIKLEKAEAARDLLFQILKSPPLDAKEVRGNSNHGRSAKRFHKGSQTLEVVTRAKKILLEAGRPLNRSELLDRMNVGEEFTITAREPARFIGRTLWEDPDFIHIPKLGYWLLGMELPQDAP